MPLPLPLLHWLNHRSRLLSRCVVIMTVTVGRLIGLTYGSRKKPGDVRTKQLSDGDVANRITFRPVSVTARPHPVPAFDAKKCESSLAVRQSDVSADEARLALYVSSPTCLYEYRYGMLRALTGHPTKSGSEDGVLSKASYHWLKSVLISPTDDQMLYAIDSNTIRFIDLRSGQAGCAAGYYGKDKHTNGDPFYSHIETPYAMCWRPVDYNSDDLTEHRPDSMIYIAASLLIRTLALPYPIERVLSTELSHSNARSLHTALPIVLIRVIASYFVTTGWLDTLSHSLENFTANAIAATPSGVLVLPTSRHGVIAIDPHTGEGDTIWARRAQSQEDVNSTTGLFPYRVPHSTEPALVPQPGRELLGEPAGCVVVEADQCAYITDASCGGVFRLTLSPNWFKPRRPLNLPNRSRVHKSSGRSAHANTKTKTKTKKKHYK